MGGELLGCFQTGGSPAPSASGESPAGLSNYAIAISLPGRDRGPADLEKMLATVRQQWQNFDPASDDFKTYTARLNAFIARNGNEVGDEIASIKPLLVNIKYQTGQFYLVTSLRTYLLNLNGRKIASEKIDASAMVLRSGQMIRLAMMRAPVTGDAVAQAQDAIEQWARAVAQGKP